MVSLSLRASPFPQTVHSNALCVAIDKAKIYVCVCVLTLLYCGVSGLYLYSLTFRWCCLANALRGLLNLLQGLQSASRMHGTAFNVRLSERYQIRSRHIVRNVGRPIAQTLQDTHATFVAHANVVGHRKRTVRTARTGRADLWYLFHIYSVASKTIANQ